MNTAVLIAEYVLLGAAALVALAYTLDTLVDVIRILRITFTRRGGQISAYGMAVQIGSTLAANLAVVLAGWLVLR